MYRSGTVMAWNVFKFCTALRGLGSIMILLVLGVVGVTYYAVVVSNYAPDLYQGGFVSVTALAVLILFHLILVMLLWSYFAVVFTDPGSVPPNWKPLLDEERGDADPLTGSEYGGMPPDSVNPRIRYCRKCNQLKPPRCHHCSVCGRCILKMDPYTCLYISSRSFLNFLKQKKTSPVYTQSKNKIASFQKCYKDGATSKPQINPIGMFISCSFFYSHRKIGFYV